MLVAALAGCAVGPNYKRPAVDSPDGLPHAPPRIPTRPPARTPSPTSAGGRCFKTRNSRPTSARRSRTIGTSRSPPRACCRPKPSLRITRSQFFPTINAGGDLVTSRASEKGPSPVPSGVNPQREYGDVFVSMPAYEVDLWGKIRRANEAARAQLLATEEAQRTVRQTLVAQVATAYLDLLELDL